MKKSKTAIRIGNRTKVPPNLPVWHLSAALQSIDFDCKKEFTPKLLDLNTALTTGPDKPEISVDSEWPSNAIFPKKTTGLIFLIKN